MPFQHRNSSQLNYLRKGNASTTFPYPRYLLWRIAILRIPDNYYSPSCQLSFWPIDVPFACESAQRWLIFVKSYASLWFVNDATHYHNWPNHCKILLSLTKHSHIIFLICFVRSLVPSVDIKGSWLRFSEFVSDGRRECVFSTIHICRHKHLIYVFSSFRIVFMWIICWYCRVSLSAFSCKYVYLDFRPSTKRGLCINDLRCLIYREIMKVSVFRVSF